MPPLSAQYATKHLNYLMQAHPQLYQELKTTGQLEARLNEVGKRAEEMRNHILSKMISQYETIEDEHQKAVKRGQVLLTIKEQVEHEIVFAL